MAFDDNAQGWEMDTGATLFRAAFLPVWRVVTEWSAGGAVVVLAASGLFAGGLPFALHLVIVALAAALGSLLIPLAIRYYPVWLSPDGLRCSDAYGFYRVARWDAISGIRPFNFVGLRYLRVYAADTPRPLWLPLFLSDRPGFTAEAERLAGPDHPLVRAVRGDGKGRRAAAPA